MSTENKKHVRETRFVENPNSFEDLGFYFKQKQRDDRSSLLNSEDLPIPEDEFLKYNDGPERYLKSGKRDSKKIRRLLIKHGVEPKRGPGNILEFGCANSRVLRWFADWAEYGEAWGVDIDSRLVFWCHQNLSPPFHFAVSTTQPSLFFEDRFFSLVYATSIFTHIDDLYLSWICELRRITKPGGFVFITIHDEYTHQIQSEQNSGPFQSRMNQPVYQKFLETNSDFCSCGRDLTSLVSFRREYLTNHLSRYFEVVEIIDKAMAAQSGILLKRNR